MRKIEIDLEGHPAELIQEFLSGDPMSEHTLLDPVVAAYNLPDHGDRAILEFVTINGVTLRINEAGYLEAVIEYEYGWSAYYGCKDMDTGDIESDVLVALINDNKLVFEVPDVRDTCEEF